MSEATLSPPLNTVVSSSEDTGEAGSASNSPAQQRGLQNEKSRLRSSSEKSLMNTANLASDDIENGTEPVHQENLQDESNIGDEYTSSSPNNLPRSNSAVLGHSGVDDVESKIASASTAPVKETSDEEDNVEEEVSELGEEYVIVDVDTQSLRDDTSQEVEASEPQSSEPITTPEDAPVSKKRSGSVFQNFLIGRQKPQQNNQLSFSSWCWKEGGRVRSWKRRFFKVVNNEITYGKNPTTIISRIPLQIITSIMPYKNSGAPLKFQEFGWRMTTKKDSSFREYFIVAESKTEASIWINFIEKVTRVSVGTTSKDFASLEAAMKESILDLDIPILNMISNNEVDSSFLHERMSKFFNSLTPKDKTIGFTTYRQCISGSEILQCIQGAFGTLILFDSMKIAQILLGREIIEGVNVASKGEILDDKNALYRVNPSRYIEAKRNGREAIPTQRRNLEDEVLSETRRERSRDNRTINETLSEKSAKQSLDSSVWSQSRARRGSSIKSESIKKEKISSNLGAVSTAILYFSENTSRIEFLISKESARVYPEEVRQKKIENRYKVALEQQTFIAENIADTLEYESLRMRKVKRELAKMGGNIKLQDELSSRRQSLLEREALCKENIHRIKKLQIQFDVLVKRLQTIEKDIELKEKKKVEQRFFQMIREENKWEKSPQVEVQVPTSKAIPEVSRIKVKGRKSSRREEDTENTVGGGIQTFDSNSSVLVTIDTYTTIKSIEESTRETVKRLEALSVELTELVELYKDLKNIVQENQFEFDAIESNIMKVSANIEQGIKNVENAKSHLPSSQFKTKIDTVVGRANKVLSLTGLK